MRDPLNHQTVDVCLNDKTYLVFNDLPMYDKEDYDLNVDKEYKRYILDIKRDVRTSFEYSKFILYLKENLDMNKCSFFKNISSDDGNHRVKIEIHHDPFTIEDIIRIVAKKRLDNQENIDVPMVAKEVAYLHYILLVGLIPLSTTVHELVGNGFLFIPTTKVFGRYKEFVKLYDQYILPEQKDILDRIEAATSVYNEAEASKILEKHLIYVDLDNDEYQLPSYQEIIDLMKQRVTNINQDNEQRNLERNLINPIKMITKDEKRTIF